MQKWSSESALLKAPMLYTIPGMEQKSYITPIPVELVRQGAEDWIVEAQYLKQSPKTIRSKRDSIEKFLWWCQYQRVTELRQQEIRKFLAYIVNAHLTPEGRWGQSHLKKEVTSRTLQSYFVNLRTLLKWLEEQQVIPQSPMTGLPQPKPVKHQVEPFSQEQVKLILETARRTTQPVRDVAIIQTLLNTGLRASELCDLKLSNLNIHINHGFVSVLGKGSKRRQVPFNKDAARAIRNYLQETPRMQEDYVFLSTRGSNGRGAKLTVDGLGRVFRRIKEVSNISGVRCSPHTCRHTFAVDFLRNGGNAFALKMILGHENLQMTQKYVMFAQADILNQHQQFGPSYNF